MLVRATQVVHVEVVRAYGRLVRLVLQHGQLLRRLQCATAALQREAQLWEEVPVAKEEACYKLKKNIDKISLDIQVGAHSGCTLLCLTALPDFRSRNWCVMVLCDASVSAQSPRGTPQHRG